MDDFIISLVAVGDFYVHEIESTYYRLKNEGYEVKILTNNPKFFDKRDIVVYQKENFNYFDKIYFSIDLIKQYGKTVIYFDGSDSPNIETIIRRILKEDSHFIYRENWPKGDFYNYKDENCFRFLLEYLNYRKMPLINYPTISEKLMIFNKKLDHKLVKSELEKIQPVFDYISVMNYTTYSKPFVIGGAEGLALSIVLTNNQIPITKLL